MSNTSTESLYNLLVFSLSWCFLIKFLSTGQYLRAREDRTLTLKRDSPRQNVRLGKFKLFLKILQYSQESTCVGVSFNKVAGS